MNDKIKRMMIYNCIVSIITLMVLIGFSIIFLREGYIQTGPRILSFQILILLWCSLHFFFIIRNLRNAYRRLSTKYEASEEINESITNNNPCGILILNKDRIIEYVNPTTERMMQSKSIIGNNLLEFEVIRDKNIHKCIDKAFLGQPSKLINEHYITHLSKEHKVFNINFSPIKSKHSKKIERIVIIANDITQEALLKDEMEATNISTFRALARLVDARDSYTGMHSTNVMKYTEMICDGLLIEEEEKEKIMISANLHDIGKIGIDDSILKKDGKLTNEEYRKMKLHPVIGASIIGDIKGFEEISTIIKYHHERYDGEGYPIGLKGEEIPLGSQIIAIADAFDAITTNRIYRKSLGYVAAIDILKYEKGKQFNSELVDVFIRELEKNHMQDYIDSAG